MSNTPSIFNDIIGPVMRGPSSSHTAASWRIARTCLDILSHPLKKALIEFDEDGAWAPNYQDQGTVMGINGGLLGLTIVDDQMKNTEEVARKKEIEIKYQVSSFPTSHTNTVRLTLEDIAGKTLQIIAVSTGGGAFEIQQIDNLKAEIKGDCHELLLWMNNDRKLPDILSSAIENKLVHTSSNEHFTLLNIKSPKSFAVDFIDQLHATTVFDKISTVDPVLPILSGYESELPFSSISSLLVYAQKNLCTLGELGIQHELSLSGLTRGALKDTMENIIQIIESSINRGLEGTIYKDRILHHQSQLIDDAERNNTILQNRLINNTIAYVTAAMEAKSSLEVVVANPTAGSCGTVGGALRAVAEELNSSFDDVVNAYFAAGLVGVFFAKGPGFSAEEHGCQVECGAASGMAAAGIVQLMGGDAKQAIDGASMAIQNMIGLVCDPVADRVEVPCLGKNISAAMNALSSATMACAGFDAVIPLEEVIESVVRVGKKMPSCVKCTGKDGLSITPTSVAIKNRLSLA